MWGEMLSNSELVERARVALSAARGKPCVLEQQAELVGSGRTVVLRCAASGDDLSDRVVVKAYRDRSGFPAEAAGLGVAPTGTVPELLAVDEAVPLIVMSDLGDGPSLATLLLGDDRAATSRALSAWVDGLGELAKTGREGEFAAVRDGYAGEHAASSQEPAAVMLPRLLDALAAVGVAEPDGLVDELAELASLKDDGPYPVFSPGDTCPDNNVVTGEEIHFLDLESCGFVSAFLVAAYLRMPFATCWCVFRLPDEVASAAEARYRAHVVGAHPELADDSRWQRGVLLASALWTVGTTVGLLPATVQGDRPMHASIRPVPTARQLLRYRWERLTAALDDSDDLPAIRRTGHRLLATFAERWEPVEALPHYPAFLRTIRS